MPWPVQIQRLARELQKRLGIQGFLSLTLVEDVQPVVQVLGGPESYVPRGEELRGARTSQAAGGVGIASRVYLVNPAGSGRLAAVEQLVAYASVAGELELFVQGIAAEVGVTTGRPRDTRLGLPTPVPQTTLRLAGDNILGTGVTLLSWNVVAGETLQFTPAGLVLSPGFLLGFTSTARNHDLTAGFWWRDWPAAPQELVVP